MPELTDEEMLKIYDDGVRHAEQKQKFTDEQMLKFYEDGVNGAKSINQKNQSQDKSFTDSAIDWLEPKARGAAMGVTYGFAPKITAAAESAFTDKTYDQALSESRANYKEAQENDPIGYGASELGGAILSPINKVAMPISVLKKVKDAEKYARLLKMAQVAGTGAIQGGIAGAGYGDNIGDVGKGVLGGAVLSSAARVAPMTTMAGVGAYALSDSDIKNISYPEIAALGLGSVADLLMKTPQGRGALANLKGGLLAASNNKDIKKAYKMMEPLEKLESSYEDIGSKIPESRRAENQMYSPAKGAPMSDSMKDMYAAIDDITIQTNDALSNAEKNILSSELSAMGELRHKTLGEILVNDNEKERVFKTIDELNKSRGIKEDALTTINKHIEALKAANESVNPYKEKVSSFIVGRMMKPSYSHAQPLATAMAYANKSGSLGEREMNVYENLLKMNQEVKAGILNKWFQNVGSDGEITDNVTRYFRGKNLLSPDDVRYLEENGIKAFPSKKEMRAALGDMVEKSKIAKATQESDEKQKLLAQMRDRLKRKSYDLESGKFIDQGQALTDMKIDLKNMGQLSKFVNLPGMELTDDVLLDILDKYKGNPKKINETIDLLNSAGFNQDEIVKALSNKNHNLEYMIQDIKKQKLRLEKEASIDDKSLMRESEKRRRQAEREMLKSKIEDAKKAILSDRNEQVSSYEQRLFDMNEGKRQLLMSRPDSLAKTAYDAVPGSGFVGNSFRKLSQFLSKKDIKNMAKNEEYYRDLYQQGKEKLSQINPSYDKVRPEQIADSFLANPSFLRQLSSREGRIGELASDVLSELQSKGIEGAKSKLFLLAIDPDFRRLFAVDEKTGQTNTANSNPQSQERNKPWVDAGTP